VAGDGAPLILQHGFSGSIELWHELGYVERLHKDYRLILVDARGHGASDKPYEPEAYELERFVSDITAVLDDLHIGKAHYWGYSMGGWIGFGMAKYAAQRSESLIIGGAQPYGRSFAQARETLRKGIDGWTTFLADQGIFSPAALARAQNNDAQALRALIQDRPDISNILPNVTLPCLLYAGSADSQFELANRCAQELPSATMVTLPDLNHFQVMARSDLVVPQVVRFLASL
jgi:pimeloyl-ACP methyl ester carboxylesterase